MAEWIPGMDMIARPPVDTPTTPADTLTVTPPQMRVALLKAGKLGAVEAAVTATKVADPAVGIWWEYATEFRKNHPLIQAMAAAAGLTKLEVDVIFNSAALL